MPSRLSPGPALPASPSRELCWSVVMPVYNEQGDVERSVRQVHGQLRLAGVGFEIVAVDDGSTDRTAQVLDQLADGGLLRVVHQANAGRFAARLAGLRAAGGDMVLLVDAGLDLHPGSLAHLAEQVAAHPDRAVWNGDIHVATAANRYGAFWKVLTQLGWSGYCRHRTLTSYTLADFDRYPKGTGLFAAPRAWLLDAAEGLDRPDTRRASDDTALVRSLLVRAGRVWLSPGFAATYQARDTAAAFSRQCVYRGATFVDGYLTSDGPVGRALRIGLLGVGVAAAGTCGLAARALARTAHRGHRPVLTPAAVPAGLATAVFAVAAAPSVVRSVAERSACSPKEVCAAATVTPLFAVTFGTGLLRGLASAAGSWHRRRERSPGASDGVRPDA